jgi:cytochrome b
LLRHTASGDEYRRVRIWDPAIRLWHWLLVLTVTAGWLLGEFRSFSTVEWHVYLGYCTGTLVVLRLIWGFAGPESARFSALLFPPVDIVDYARRMGTRDPSGFPGHNPLGALSVLVMLALLIVQVGTGLFSEDDALFASGPLSGWLSSKGVVRATAIHNIGATLIPVVVGIHVAAVAYYLLWKRENLIAPMITGWKWVRLKSQREQKGTG